MTNYFIIIFILVVFLCILEKVVNGAKHKGIVGEKEVSRILQKLNEIDYKSLHNITLPNGNKTCQIDHIIVSIHGIFVIETKNYRGWIYGKEYSDQWTQNIYGKKNRFHNPIKQNYGHVKVLSELLDLELDEFIPIVVFMNKADLKVECKSDVINLNQLLKTIGTYKEIRFNNDKLLPLTEMIMTTSINSREVDKEHVNQIRKTLADDNKKVNNGICPKCGGKLILRNGKYGQFYGCSSYPKCRFTLKT